MSGRTAVLGVDFGGTKIALGVVADDGAVLSSHEVPSRVADGAEAVRAALAEAVADSLHPHPEVRRVGVGFKGPLDARRGLSLSLIGIGGMVEGWADVPVGRLVRDGVRERLGRDVDVWLENDVTVAALGEHWFGAARGANNWIFVICGTGIGVKCFEGGRLLRGQGAAGEFGHTVIDPTRTDLVCGCGSRLGHLEALASGQSLDQRARLAVAAEPAGAVAGLARAAGEPPAGEHVVAAAQAGDGAARAIVEDVQRYLGYGLANLINTFNPELIVVGGGVATGTDGFILNGARDVALARALPALAAKTRVATSALERDAGVLGAAYLALRAGDV